MIKDDWITKLYIMENMIKTYQVPVKMGWLSDYYDPENSIVEWADNVENFTEQQALFFCDVISEETKPVSKLVSDDEFLEIIAKLEENIKSI